MLLSLLSLFVSGDNVPQDPNALAQQVENLLSHIGAPRTDNYRVKIPSFFREQPECFFIRIESSFERARITSETSKAHSLIESLEPDLIAHIKDLIVVRPEPDNLYTLIKDRLISSFAVSAETRLRQLLKGEVHQEGKPSLFLNKLRSLNDSGCSDAILKTIFLDHLSANVRAILAMSNIDDLSELAKQADRVVEASGPSSAHTFAASQQKPQVAATSSQDHFASLLGEFTKTMQELIKTVNNPRTQRGRSNSRSEGKRDRSRSKSKNGLCYYHQRFKKKASKCVKPCSWKESPSSEN